MITLTLLHPLREIAVQSWTFEDKSTIRIGRAPDNEVVLYSAVVSRYHVEVKKTEQSWEVINLGANGTYVDGKKITKAPIFDGTIFRLATSGPKILVKIESEFPEPEELDELHRQEELKKKILKSSKDTLIN
ncbi:FHA domain-containing protein [Myxosarcina sp. GI1(2024)]